MAVVKELPKKKSYQPTVKPQIQQIEMLPCLNERGISLNSLEEQDFWKGSTWEQYPMGGS